MQSDNYVKTLQKHERMKSHYDNAATILYDSGNKNPGQHW